MSADAERHRTVGQQRGASAGSSADPADVIAAIERPEQFCDSGPANSGGASRFLPALDLPGFGEEYDDCGDDIPKFCESCGHVSVFGRTCYRSECPRCGDSWARRRGTSISAKLDALRRYLYSTREGNQLFHHVAVSPKFGAWELAADDVLETTFDVIREVMGALDFQGVAFYHPWSGRDGDDRGKWKRRLFSNREWTGDVRDELTLRPHFHIVGVSDHVAGGELTKRVEAETGWVIHRITQDGSNVSIGNDHDLARAVTYCLSHTGLYETDSGTTRAAYRYVGKEMNRVTASEKNETRIDTIVRSIASQTLGLEYQSLACVQQVREQADVRVSLAQAAASSFDPRRLDAGVGSGDGAAEQLAEPTTALAEADQTTDQDEERECSGRMLNIAKAPNYLDDDEWCAAAAHAEDLRAEFQKWREKLDWLG